LLHYIIQVQPGHNTYASAIDMILGGCCGLTR